MRDLAVQLEIRVRGFLAHVRKPVRDHAQRISRVIAPEPKFVLLLNKAGERMDSVPAVTNDTAGDYPSLFFVTLPERVKKLASTSS